MEECVKEVVTYFTIPEESLRPEVIMGKLKRIRSVSNKRVLFGRWDYTRYKRIYVDIDEKMQEMGYIDLVRVKFVVTVKPELEFFTPELIDAASKEINIILDEYRQDFFKLKW